MTKHTQPFRARDSTVLNKWKIISRETLEFYVRESDERELFKDKDSLFSQFVNIQSKKTFQWSEELA